MKGFLEEKGQLGRRFLEEEVQVGYDSGKGPFNVNIVEIMVNIVSIFLVAVVTKIRTTQDYYI